MLRVSKACANQHTGISAADITKLKANGFYTVAVRFSGLLDTVVKTLTRLSFSLSTVPRERLY